MTPPLPDLSPIGPFERDGPALLREWSARGMKDQAIFDRVMKLRAKVVRQRLARRFDDAAESGS